MTDDFKQALAVNFTPSKIATRSSKYRNENLLQRHPITAEPRPLEIPRLTLGSTYEFFVTVWFGNSGFCKPIGPLARNRNNHCYFNVRDVVTLGTLHVGARIRGVVTENPGTPNHRLFKVEIFQEEIQQEDSQEKS
jgi:hypothetical protein